MNRHYVKVRQQNVWVFHHTVGLHDNILNIYVFINIKAKLIALLECEKNHKN